MQRRNMKNCKAAAIRKGRGTVEEKKMQELSGRDKARKQKKLQEQPFPLLLCLLCCWRCFLRQ